MERETGWYPDKTNPSATDSAHLCGVHGFLWALYVSDGSKMFFLEQSLVIFFVKNLKDAPVFDLNSGKCHFFCAPMHTFMCAVVSVSGGCPGLIHGVDELR